MEAYHFIRIKIATILVLSAVRVRLKPGGKGPGKRL